MRCTSAFDHFSNEDEIEHWLTAPNNTENMLLTATTRARCSTISGGTRLSKYKPRITSKTPLIKKYFILNQDSSRTFVMKFNTFVLFSTKTLNNKSSWLSIDTTNQLNFWLWLKSVLSKAPNRNDKRKTIKHRCTPFIVSSAIKLIKILLSLLISRSLNLNQTTTIIDQAVGNVSVGLNCTMFLGGNETNGDI